MKIVFIEPQAPGIHVYSRMPLPRLGTIILATILKQAGYDASVQIEMLGPLDCQEIEKADIIGISITTSTAPRGYEIANKWRIKGKVIVMGGPHATYMPEETLQHADFVLRGEADETILSLIRAIEKKYRFENILGLSYWSDVDVIHNKRVPYCKDLNRLPAPDFNLISNWQKQMIVTPIMTSRGCPYDCEFCSVTDMFGRNYRYKNPENVLLELKRHNKLIKENNIKSADNCVFFYDDNFTINKKRTKMLLKMMIEKGYAPRWTAQASVDVAKDDELLELMAKSGCYLLYIGLESINPQTLKAYNKKQNVEDIEKAIKKIHSHGIRIHGMFVLGADTDTQETIDKTVEFAQKNNLESVQFLILTPLPGSRVFVELRKSNRIKNYDWSLYDAHHAVFEPKNFSRYKLQTSVMKAMLKFYGLTYLIRRSFAIFFRDFFKDAKGSILEISLKWYGRKNVKNWLKAKKNWIEHLKGAS
ncbi:B12-binding domain-containing radical SAM protein [Candidatus Wolfebacteria bacterium]|nr:B12-binding domain-containing radical SAM protein [Candidatus Wolfebacteria bacterium]